MKQFKSLAILLLLSVVAPLAALADSFKVTPADLELGKEATLQFVLDNPEKEYYGFQAEVTLPTGLTAVQKGTDGQVDFTLSSSRVDTEGYRMNSNTLSTDNLIIGAFSDNNKPITRTNGVLVELKVNVATNFEGGDVTVSNIKFITAENKDEKLKDAITTLGVKATSITLNLETVELKATKTTTLTATVKSGDTVINKTLKWESDNTDVATVTSKGLVTAKAVGQATITVSCGDVKASCNVSVAKTPVDGLSVLDADGNPLAADATIAIHTGDNYNFTAIVTPESATDKTVTWTTSDESVIEFLDNEGLIKALKAGNATVTANIAEFSVTINVNVTDATVPVTGITLDQTAASMSTNKTLQLKATVEPSDATSKNVSWSSSDKSIATVSTTGLVTALKAGKVTITATANGNFKATCEITISDIEVSSVTLNNTATTLTEGETVTLTATVFPDDATNKTVTWTSTDENVVTVDEDGIVTALKAGSATITANAGKVSASCTVTVNPKFIAVTGITLNAETLSLTEDETATLTASVLPGNATDKTVTWSSSDATVATVENGVVTAVGAGSATITAKAGEKIATCVVTVAPKVIEVTGVTLDKTEATLTVGESLTLVATVIPAEATTDKSVTWASSDATVATVENGMVTAVKAGSATITVTTANGKIASCVITVEAAPVKVTGVTLNKTTAALTEGESRYLVAKITPSDAFDMTVTWSSSDDKVAMVDEYGKVTAVKAGNTTITATSKGDPAISASCAVTVTTKDPEEVAITWPMTADGDINLTPMISDGAEGLTAGEAVIGSEISLTRVLPNNSAAFAAIQPKEKVTKATDGHTVTFSIETQEGSTFTPTGIDYVATVFGTDGGKYDLNYTWNGKTEKLQSDFHPNRNNAANGFFSAESLSIADAAAANGKFEVTFSVYNLDNTKELGLSNVVIKGKLGKIIDVTGITLDLEEATIVEGKSLTLVPTVAPEEATDKTVTWSSDNEAVATVDENGKVTGVAVGNAIITAKAGDYSATCAITVEENLVGASNVPVKMTYVDYDNPDTSFGEIGEGETAKAGYNGDKNGVVTDGILGFANTSWGANWITYLQVDISSIKEINGNITSATLSFEGSQAAIGSTSSRGRVTNWGVGYNSYEWSANMTYNDVSKDNIGTAITLLGGTQAGGPSKSDDSIFTTLSFDITNAVKHADENGLITILVYENAAGGGYIKNPVVSVNWTKEPTYNVTFTEKNAVEGVKVTVDDSDVTNGTSLLKGTYSFTATAPHYKDYIGNFTVTDKDLEVEFEMTPKAIWNYTVKNNVNDEVKTGTTYEGESAYIFFSKYILAKDGTVWSREVANNKTHEVSFTPDKDGYVYTLEYSETDMKDGIFFKEAEDEYYTDNNVLIATGTTADRGSNKLGGYTAEESAKLYTLKPGTYNIEIGAIGPASNGAVLVVKAGEETIITTTALYSTLGKYSTSEPVTVSTETDLTIEGTNSKNVLDYILITGKVNSFADYKVIFVDENGDEIKDAVTGNGIVGTAIELSEEYTKGFVKDGIPYIFDGIDPENPTIAADGTTVVTVKFHKQNEVTYTVKFVDQDGNTLKESVTRNGDAGSAASISVEDKEEIVINDVTYVYAGDNTEGLTYAYDGKTEIVITYNKVVGYTIKFVDEAGNEIQKTKECTGAIGSEIDLSEYVNGVTVDGKVYFYVNASYDPEGDTVAEGKVVTITLESAAKLPYTRAESTWSEADLTDWVSADGITKSIDNGLNVTWGNTGWALAKEINFTENSIVTLTASMTGGNTGRGEAYEYLELGGVQVRLDGQNKVGTVVIGTETFTLSGDARGGSVDIEMTINQATKNATVTVSGSCTGTNSGKITETLPNKVVFGYHKNGSLSGERTATLKSISISEEIQLVTTADYTINYVCDGEIIKTEEGNTAIDDEITAASTLTVDDQKYYVADGATTSITISGDKDNVLNVNMRKAYVYNYIVKNNVTEDVIKGSVIEGESATVSYSRYILDNDGTVWEKNPGKSAPYTISFTPDANNFESTLDYTATDITNGIFFSEAENIEGMTKATGSNADIRCSNAAGGYSAEAVTLYTLPAGTYKVRLGVWGNAGNTFIAKVGEETILTAETQGYWFEAPSEEFTVDTETALIFEGANSSKPLDYVLITGTLKEIVNSVVIDNAGATKTLTIGDTFKLTATVDSDNSATDPQVTWTSSNQTIATVDKTGNVTIIGAGNVKITASYGGKSASCTLKCYPQLGDANWDGNIDITDAVDITNYVVGKKTAPSTWDEAEWTEFYKTGANANNDDESKISFADASATVTIALAQPTVSSTPNRIIASYDDETQDALVIGGISAANGRISVPVTLDNSMEYVALQADIILPEGMNVEVKEGSRVAGSHIMATHKFADNHIRVALYNLSNTAFADNNAPIIEIIADGMIYDNEEIAISNIIAADTDANRFVLASKAAETTGVDALEFDSNAPVKVYDLNGRYISDKVEGLEQGFYIIRQGNNAKKVRIR